jgi:molybdopterin-biosynthesis enzyme MoeA-like protein
MAIGLIIIGDEILSGKRADKHLPRVIEILAARGLQLAWAEIVGDERERITATLKRSLAGGDIVFSCGGIGATPDDHTRQCAAAALGVPLVLHPEAKQKIHERIVEMAQQAGKEVDTASADYAQRLRMGEFPQGAAIIPNPYNKIPGFKLGDHHFLPGFPVMAWPMIEWVLDTHYAHLFHQSRHGERAVLLYETMEASVTPLMEEIEQRFDEVKVFSLPSVGDAQTRRHIELGVKGDAAQVEAAFAYLLQSLDAQGREYEWVGR